MLTIRPKKILLTLLALTLILFLTPTQLGKKGGTLPLSPNLNILVVRDGLFNPLIYLTELKGLPIPGDRSTDRYLQNLNAYGLATNYLKGETPNGLYLSQKEYSESINLKLQTGDVIKSIRFSPNCQPSYKGLKAAWVHTSKCSSALTIFRQQKFLTLTLPAKGGDDFDAIRVLSDHAPKSPKILNQITGHSAGLVLSLYYLDQTSKGSLLSKDFVSGSGMIEPGSLSYSAISDLPQKYIAASKANSSVLFLAKAQNLKELYNSNVKLDPKLKIYKVKNLHEIVKILCQRGAKDELCYPLRS